jgi:hypothetical protein
VYRWAVADDALSMIAKRLTRTTRIDWLWLGSHHDIAERNPCHSERAGVDLVDVLRFVPLVFSTLCVLALWPLVRELVPSRAVVVSALCVFASCRDAQDGRSRV